MVLVVVFCINNDKGDAQNKKILCKGNHDKKYNVELFNGIYDFLEIAVHGVNVSLMHYSMMSWPKSMHGSLHLHGHIHSKGDYNLQQKENGILRYDVGVDANNFCPVSIEHIKGFFEIQKRRRITIVRSRKYFCNHKSIFCSS